MSRRGLLWRCICGFHDVSGARRARARGQVLRRRLTRLARLRGFDGLVHGDLGGRLHEERGRGQRDGRVVHEVRAERPAQRTAGDPFRLQGLQLGPVQQVGPVVVADGRWGACVLDGPGVVFARVGPPVRAALHERDLDPRYRRLREVGEVEWLGRVRGRVVDAAVGHAGDFFGRDGYPDRGHVLTAGSGQHYVAGV